MSPSLSIFLLIIVTIMWGSWFQVVKHTGKFPISVFMFILYSFSLLIVFMVLFFSGELSNLFPEILLKKDVALKVLIGGMLFGIGMQINLTIVKQIGLILSASIIATCGILIGTFVSVSLGGIPAHASVATILFAALILVIASVVSQYSGVLKNKKSISKHVNSPKKENTSFQLKPILILIFANAFLLIGYPYATSIGIATAKNPNAFIPLICIGLLSMGSFLGSLIFALIDVIINKKYDDIRNPGRSIGWISLMALIGAICHFGGNIIYVIAAPWVSIGIAWPLSNSYNMWSYVWGLIYGEYKNAPKSAYIALSIGFVLFVLGMIILSKNVI